MPLSLLSRDAFLPGWLRGAGVFVVTLAIGMLLPGSATAQTSGPGGEATQDTLSLDDAVHEALSANFQVRIARTNAEVARNNVTLGNAGYLPVVTANGQASQSRADAEQVFGGNRTEAAGVVSTRYDAGAEARWTLFDGFRRGATFDRLQAERGQQEAATREQIERAVADVVIAYSDVARLQQRVTVFDEAVAISEERLEIAELRRDLGSASDLEVRQARVDLNTDRADRLRAAADLMDARARLVRLLGRETATGPPVAGEAPLDPDLQEQPLRAAAERQSPALQQARRAVDVAEEIVAEGRADWFPAIDLFAGYSYGRTKGGTGIFEFSETSQFEAGAALAFDIFDGFERQRRQENARIRVRTAEFTLADAQARLRTEITGAYERYRNRLQVLELEAENLEAAVQNVDIALERFRLGTIASIELREVQEQRIQAESRLLNARFEAKQAETELLRLSGQLVGE